MAEYKSIPISNAVNPTRIVSYAYPREEASTEESKILRIDDKNQIVVGAQNELVFDLVTILTREERVRVENYSGWYKFDFSYHDTDAVAHVELALFLPYEPGSVWYYAEGPDLISTSVMVAPSSFLGDDDERNLIAVDSATVALEPQVFGGQAGSPECLVLRVNAAVSRGDLFRIAYSVNVVSSTRTSLKPIKLDDDDRPA